MHAEAQTSSQRTDSISNVFISKFALFAMDKIGGFMTNDLNITNSSVIEEAISLTGASLIDRIAELPGIAGVPGAYEGV